MLCGDVPWEGSSRRSVSLQGSLSRGSSTCVPRGKAQPSCWRETGVSLVARFPTRPPCDSFLPTHCLVFGLSLLWGWVRSPEVLTRPQASAQGSQTFGFPPYAIVGRDDHFDWLSYKFATVDPHSS